LLMEKLLAETICGFAYNGELKQLLLCHEKEKINLGKLISRNGQSPLHYAVIGNHMDCVRFLIEKAELDINCTDSFRMSPIHTASSWGRIQILIYLISFGAKLTTKTSNEDTWESLYPGGLTPAKKLDILNKANELKLSYNPQLKLASDLSALVNGKNKFRSNSMIKIANSEFNLHSSICYTRSKSISLLYKY